MTQETSVPNKIGDGMLLRPWMEPRLHPNAPEGLQKDRGQNNLQTFDSIER